MSDVSQRESRAKRRKRFPKTQILAGFSIVSLILCCAVSLNSLQVVVRHDLAAEEKAAAAANAGAHSVRRSSSFDLAAASACAAREKSAQPPAKKRKAFDLSSWTKQTGGGLKDADRRLLGELYGSAESVFEWGLGESTHIAAEVGVPRYGGIDSDPLWVANARNQSPNHFRFYLGDTGPTKEWGRPTDPGLPKSFASYQIAPLLAEERPFDVYAVDGRMRLPCALAAFLHAASYSSGGGSSTTTTTPSSERPPSPKVLIHDYYDEVRSRGCRDCKNFGWQKKWHRIEEVADLVAHSGGMLAVFRRKAGVSDEDILRLWNEVAFEES